MPRYKLTIEYDGTGLAGFQAQEDSPSVQAILEQAIHRFCGEQVTVFCAGRTDAGVHAKGQVVHIDLEKPQDPFRIMQAVNFHLIHQPVIVHDSIEVDDTFHARFSAKGRHYRYRIFNRRARPVLDAQYVWHIPTLLDIDAMNEAAALLIGHHDFTSFRDSNCQSSSPMKTLDVLRVVGEGEELAVEASSRSFLHHQVRIMTGSLVEVGKGRWSLDDFRKARDAKDRRAGGPTAPAHGLCFLRVDY